MDTTALEQNRFITGINIQGSYPESFIDSVSGPGTSLRQRNLAMQAYRFEVDRFLVAMENSLLSHRSVHAAFAHFETKEEARGLVQQQLSSALRLNKPHTDINAHITSVTIQGIRDALLDSLWETWKGDAE